MLKRAIIAIILGLLVIIFLGVTEGFSNLINFLPLLPPYLAITLTFITHDNTKTNIKAFGKLR